MLKYRILLAREHLLYQLFNRQFVLLLIWGSYILYAVLFYSQIEKILNGVMLPVLCSAVLLFTCRHYGKILMGICSSTKEIVLTMRGIYPHKLRKMSSGEISELFQKDFQEYISNGNIKKDIVINTHALYAQGVLNLIYAKFGTDR